jgi:hypothetical protein
MELVYHGINQVLQNSDFNFFLDIYYKIIQNTMNKDFLKMQKLAGLITESQMKNKLKA